MTFWRAVFLQGLQKVKRGNRCHFLLWLHFRCFGIFSLKKCSSPCAHPSVLFYWQKLHILPFHLLFLCLSFLFSFCSATFLREWKQNKLENRSKCCNSASNRYWCDACSGYRRSICPSIIVFDRLSLHKETEATGTDWAFFYRRLLAILGDLVVIFTKQLSSYACLFALASSVHGLGLECWSPAC